ncbi:MAG: hypothetical protein AABW79_01335 [Nanoarchaeota archaeon]
MLEELVHSMQREIFKKIPFINFLSLEDISERSNALAEQLAKEKPDLVIGIANGGRYTSNIIANYLGIKEVKIHIGRKRPLLLGVDLSEIAIAGKISGYLKRDPYLIGKIPEIEEEKILLVDDDC